MSDNSAADSVNSANAATGVTGGTAAASVSAELKNEIQKIVMGVVNSVVPRTLEKSLEGFAQKMTEKLEQGTKQSEPAPVADNSAGSQEKLTMKSLQQQVESLTKSLQAQQQKAQIAEQSARDARVKSELSSLMASKLGAGNPLVGLLRDSLCDVQKRVVDGPDGRPSIKFVDEWGNEELKPLELGVTALFEGEMKPLIQQSKAQQLPPNGAPRNGFGQPAKLQVPTNQRVNPLLSAIAMGMADERPEAAQTIMNDASRIPIPTPKPQ